MTAKGFKIDIDQMREALKLAQSMYDELEERGGDVEDLVGTPPMSPTEDTVSNQYMSGQAVGARQSAQPANQKYAEAYNGQLQYLGQLIPNLQAAIQRYETEESSAAANSQSTQNQI